MMFIWYLVSLFILYLVVEKAVRSGIDNSKLGQLLREKYGEEAEQEELESPFQRVDLDD
ncbi:hypothetical protein [Aquibacillus kalidii]|uniref:hypothetical protein n=1 Tax=Aquibacillus kalidii TaxID=2762597 RepID=UPI0016468A3C|nr:hypothetical protein [Aquibacillus kalidii]